MSLIIIYAKASLRISISKQIIKIYNDNGIHSFSELNIIVHISTQIKLHLNKAIMDLYSYVVDDNRKCQDYVYVKWEYCIMQTYLFKRHFVMYKMHQNIGEKLLKKIINHYIELNGSKNNIFEL